MNRDVVFFSVLHSIQPNTAVMLRIAFMRANTDFKTCGCYLTSCDWLTSVWICSCITVNSLNLSVFLNKACGL